MKKVIYSIIIVILSVGCDFKNKNCIIHACNNLSVYFPNIDDQIFLHQEYFDIIEKAFPLALTRERDSLFIKALFKLTNIGSIEANKNTLKFIESRVWEGKNYPDLAKAYASLGDYYFNQKINDSAYIYYTKAEKIYSVLGSKKDIGKMQLSKAFVQDRIGDFMRSEISCLYALESFRGIESENRIDVYKTYCLLGIVSNELKEYDRAIAYQNKAFLILDKGILGQGIANDGFRFKATPLNNLGIVYRNKNDNKKALSYFKEALKDSSLYQKRPSLYAMLLDNTGYSELKLRNYSQLPNLFYRALHIRDSLQIIPGIVINKLHLSEYYEDQKDLTNALRFAKEAYILAKTQGIDPEDVLLCLRRLQDLDILPEKEIYFSEYIRISDSIKQLRPIMQNSLARADFRINELTVQKAHLENQNKTILFWFGLVVFIGFLLFVIRYQYTRNKELRMKEAQKKANEKIYDLMLSHEHKVKEIQYQEQTHITKRLYDSILSRLFGTRLLLDSLSGKNGDKVIKDRRIYIGELKNIEHDIKEVCEALLSHEKEDLDTSTFVTLMRDFIEKQKIVTQISISFYIDPFIPWKEIKNSSKINLYRILKDAFQEITKRVGVTGIDVTLFQEDHGIKLYILYDSVATHFETKQKRSGGFSRWFGKRNNFIVETQRGLENNKIEVVLDIE